MEHETSYLVHSETTFVAEQQAQPGIVRMERQCSNNPCGHSVAKTLHYPPSSLPLVQADSACNDGYTRIVSLARSEFFIEDVCSKESSERCGSNATTSQLLCPDGARVLDLGSGRFCKPESAGSSAGKMVIRVITGALCVACLAVLFYYMKQDLETFKRLLASFLTNEVVVAVSIAVRSSAGLT